MRSRSRWLRSLVHAQLRGLQRGQLTIIDGTATERFGASASDLEPVVLRVCDWRFYRHVVFGGSLGVAKSYLNGGWECNNLANLMRLFARNNETATALNGAAAWLAQQIARAWHWSRRNTRAGSRKNIAAHYDLGNDFYALFLDPTMTYSSAVFEPAGISLEQAQTEKYDRICRKLQLVPADHLVEIGCGWGGFAIHAARRYGCRVTATTISQRQLALARQRVVAAGLADRVQLLQTDYRDLHGQYDKLASIEMIEAVGYEHLNRYFETCSRLLRPQGLMALQAITIPDQRFARYRRSVDFIQRYVFPGGFLPSLGAIQRAVGKQTDLRMVHCEDFAGHYAETLRIWSARFEQRLAEVRQLGLPERFIRLWRYYLAYCEAGFRERMIGLAQFMFAKPASRDDSRMSVLAALE